MNDGLAAVAINVFFFYHGCPISRLTLFNDRGAVSLVSVVVVTVAHCNARTDRAYPHANIIRQSWRCDNRYERCSQKILLHI
jgi:hypothetical protein